MTGTFAYFARPDAIVYFPGAAFLLGAVFALASLILALKSLANYKAEDAIH
jgi:DHA1 family tetracycline resistance protein-like MFS transporter